MLSPTEARKEEVVPPVEGRAAQLRYERGLPTVTATTTTAMRTAVSRPVETRSGRMESK
jgi:hypothetical protein